MLENVEWNMLIKSDKWSQPLSSFQTRPLVQPPQYKLDPRLARLLGVHTQTRASIMQALWLYIKVNQLQDSQEKEYINCNHYLRQVPTWDMQPGRKQLCIRMGS